MLYKVGSRGEVVKGIQEVAGVAADGIFGKRTAEAIKKWQSENKLPADGIVGPNTLGKMGLADTDNTTISDTIPGYLKFSKKEYKTDNGLNVVEFFMPKGEYKDGPINAEYIFLHHTAGWHNPYNCIKQWAGDDRGAISTEFVLGGPSVKGNDDNFDGVMVQAFPKGNWGYHLGKNGNFQMHKNSIGVEVCNFGYIKDGKTYAGTKVAEDQIVKLDKPFRGYQEWHRYSDKQIEALEKWIKWIGERDSIDIRKGLPELIKEKGAAAFEFNEDAYYGKVKGIWTHTNTRKDKFDMFPQQELLDMLVSL